MLRTPTEQKHGKYLSCEVLEIFSCGDPAHLAVRFPVRIQALDNELRHLRTEGRRHAAQLYGWNHRKGSKKHSQPALFPPSAAGLGQQNARKLVRCKRVTLAHPCERKSASLAAQPNLTEKGSCRHQRQGSGSSLQFHISKIQMLPRSHVS